MVKTTSCDTELFDLHHYTSSITTHFEGLGILSFDLGQMIVHPFPVIVLVNPSAFLFFKRAQQRYFKFRKMTLGMRLNNSEYTPGIISGVDSQEI